MRKITKKLSVVERCGIRCFRFPLNRTRARFSRPLNVVAGVSQAAALSSAELLVTESYKCYHRNLDHRKCVHVIKLSGLLVHFDRNKSNILVNSCVHVILQEIS